MTWENCQILSNFINFHECHEKWTKVGQTLSRILMKVHGAQQSFSQSQFFWFSQNLISFHFIYDQNLSLQTNIAVT